MPDWAEFDKDSPTATAEDPPVYFGTRKGTRLAPVTRPQTQAQKAYQSRQASGGETGVGRDESPGDRARRRAYAARGASGGESGISRGTTKGAVREEVDDVRSMSEAKMWVRNAFVRDPDAYQRIAELIRRITGDTPTPQEVEKWWDQAVTASANYFNQPKGKIKMTPEQLLAKWAERSEALGVTENGRKSTTSTSTSINLTDESTLRGKARTGSTRALGRYLSADEEGRYISAIQAAERANPSKTTTKTTTDEQGNTTSSSETSGGLDVGTELESRLMEHPDYAEYQAAGYYAPILFQMLGATVPGAGT